MQPCFPSTLNPQKQTQLCLKDALQTRQQGRAYNLKNKKPNLQEKHLNKGVFLL
jgi:hypothetical protein